MLITPVQLNFDRLDLVLRRLGLSVVDVSRYALSSLSERSHSVEIETALLQLGSGPIPVRWVAVTPHFCRGGITGVRITSRRRGWRGLLGSADKANATCCCQYSVHNVCFLDRSFFDTHL